jgi:hypothetical protein
MEHSSAPVSGKAFTWVPFNSPFTKYRLDTDEWPKSLCALSAPLKLATRWILSLAGVIDNVRLLNRIRSRFCSSSWSRWMTSRFWKIPLVIVRWSVLVDSTAQKVIDRSPDASESGTGQGSFLSDLGRLNHRLDIFSRLSEKLTRLFVSL